MDKIPELYKALLRRYGRQGWWPADSPYEMVAGAILAQNTAWANAEKALSGLRKANAISPEKVLGMGIGQLRRLIRPSGFYNQKAERLKAISKWFSSRAKAAKRLDRMSLREELLSIRGVGKETADSIALYAFGKPIFVVDAYTRRFCQAYNIMESRDYDDYRLRFEEAIGLKPRIFKEFHALIVAWGKDSRIRQKTK
jgi:endonuclease III related protein